MADVGEGLAWRWEGDKSGGGIFTDGCPVASHIRRAGGQADSNRCSPPSNLRLGNQKHMAPHNGSSVISWSRIELWGLCTQQHTATVMINIQLTLPSTCQCTATTCSKYILAYTSKSNLSMFFRLLSKCFKPNKPCIRRMWIILTQPLNSKNVIKQNKCSLKHGEMLLHAKGE